MTSDSKIFVGLRSTRKKPVQHREVTGPKCQWEGCEEQGIHRAPVGADAEGLYLLFCAKHVSEYSRGYNFVTKLSDPITAPIRGRPQGSLRSRVVSLRNGDRRGQNRRRGAGVAMADASQRALRHEVLGLEGAKRGVRFPRWQIGDDGQLLRVLAQLFEALMATLGRCTGFFFRKAIALAVEQVSKCCAPAG